MAGKRIDALDKAKVEQREDGWDRYREAIHAAAKSGPKHRESKPPVKVRGGYARGKLKPGSSVFKDKGKP